MASKRFAGIDLPSDLTRANFIFLYLNTVLAGILLSIPGLIQPAFLKDIIHVSDEYFGSINGMLQSMSQISSLLFIGIIGILSDKIGRKPPAVAGFFLLMIFYLLFRYSNSIAAQLHIPPGFSASICAALSFSGDSEIFTEFSPGLLMAYLIRFMIGLSLVLVFPQFKTMAADYTAEKDRGKGMALNAFMIGVGSLMVFTVFTPISRKSGVEILFYYCAGIALAGTLLSYFGLKERLPEKKSQAGGLKDIAQVFKRSLPLKASYLCSLVIKVDVVITPTFLIAWAVQLGPQYGLTSEAASFKGAIPMMVLGIFTMVAFPVFGILLDRWGRIPTIILALSLGGAGFFSIASSGSPFPGIFSILGVLLVGCCICGAIVGSSALAVDAAPPELVGASLGGLNTTAQIGTIFFLFSGGIVFDKLGPSWVFLLKGIVNIALAVLFFMWRKQIAVQPQRA
jgi:MFS family permease